MAHLLRLLAVIVLFYARGSNSLDPFSVLQVALDCSDADVRKSYRKLALQYHPDKCHDTSCAGKFEDIAESYELISDARRRAEYASGSQVPGRGPLSRRSFDVFESMFGDSAWDTWQPGDHIKTQFTRNGRNVRLEIFPDGTSVESEEDPSSHSSYQYFSKSSAGIRQVHIQTDSPLAALAITAFFFLVLYWVVVSLFIRSSE
mmetsp:Transcript_43884/g.99186  ORF Transcript_43884/g.99186 Transcript_43884/m.99186 type:complete len:203 (+) Transcript_43884:14-622(+)